MYKVENICIPFSGISKVEKNKDKLKISIIKEDNELETVINVSDKNTTISLESIYNIIKKIIDNGISKILYDKNIEFDEYISPDKMVDDIYEKEKNIFEAKKISDIAGISGANVNFNESYAETKGFMNGERGHGYAAEYGNNTFDRLMQKDVINAGQILDERGRQVKHGPDRIVDGEAIQTKYYKTANETIGVLFPKGQAIYLNSDGTMMPVEVPRDQYDQAVELMQKRIDSGQVPNAEPGTPAQNFVKKGWFTYNQACNICKAGTIESLSVDVASGVISSSLPGTISGVIFFAICIWNGKSIKDAAKSSLIATLKTMGKSIFIYTLTMQLSRGQFANVFSQKFTKDGIMAGYEGIANPVAHLSNELAKKISQSTLAKTSIGEFLGLRMVTGRAIISGTIIGVVVFGPDLVRALRGRISKMQLLKNSAVGAGSLAGAAIGQVLLPIPVVGAIVVAGVSGFIVKKTLDKFIEDDAIAMFQILKEEFLDVTMSMNLSKKEFDEVTLKVICNDRIHIKLQEMYQSGDARNFACAMVTNSVCSIIKDRKKIESEIVENGYTELFKKEVLQLM